MPVKAVANNWQEISHNNPRVLLNAHVREMNRGVNGLHANRGAADDRQGERSRYPRAYARGTLDQNPKSNWSFNCPLWTLSWNST